MKSVLMGVAVLLVVGLIYLGVKGSEAQEIYTEIDIAAPPAEVWEVLTNIERWQEWSPIIEKSSGLSALGETLEITMAGKDAKSEGPSYSPKIIEFTEPMRFHWRAHMIASFMMTNDKIFELQKSDSGTKLIHKELFSGLMAPLFCGKMEEGVPPMLNAMNQALKNLIEVP